MSVSVRVRVRVGVRVRVRAHLALHGDVQADEAAVPGVRVRMRVSST